MEGGHFDDNQFNQLINNSPSTDGYVSNNKNSNANIRTKKEKWLTVAILSVAAVAVFFGYFQLSGSIGKPFSSVLSAKNTNSESEQCADGNCQNSVGSQSMIDTDSDGLLDYEELTIHKTSPYLEDSDSDGMDDKYEVDMGYDPNCPGKDFCFTTGSTDGENSVQSIVPTFQSTVPTTGVTTPNVSVIRDIFKASGIPEDELNKLTDEQILTLYDQMVASQTGETADSSSASSGSDSTASGSVDDLKNLTGAQIRELLIAQGLPESVLTGISDDDLKTMFLSQLESQMNQ